MLFDYGLYGFGRKWFYVNDVGHRRIGLYCSGVAVEQYHAVTFLVKCLAGLASRIVELRSLAYLYGARAQDKYAFDGHLTLLPPYLCRNPSFA